MQVQFTINDREKQAQRISLKRLVAKLLIQFQPWAVKHRSFIVNDVPGDFYVHADKNSLVTIISYLLHSIVNRSRNGCIRITVKRYNNIILFRLNDSNAANILSTDCNWQKIDMLAKELGGCVIEDDLRKKHATITLSFRCLANAA